MEVNQKTELVSLWVTKEVAKQLNEVKDSDKLKDEIIRRLVTDEIGWLNNEVEQMDEAVLRYKAKLLTIKDNFGKAQDAYCTEIVAAIERSESVFKPIEENFDNLKSSIQTIDSQINGVSKCLSDLNQKIGYIDYTRLEKLLDAVDRFNKMSDAEKELITLILNKPQ